jgi:hypothetical protein
MQCFVGSGAGRNVIYIAVVAKISLRKRVTDNTGPRLGFAEEAAGNQWLNSAVEHDFCGPTPAARTPKF